MSIVFYIISYKICLLFYNSFSCRSTILFSSTVFNISQSSSRSFHKVLQTFIFSSPSNHTYTCSLYINSAIIISTHTHSYLISLSNILRSVFIHSYILGFIKTKGSTFNYNTKIRRVSSFFRSLSSTNINTINTCYI